MKRFVAWIGCILACTPAAPIVSIAKMPATITQQQTPRPRDASVVVVTGAPYGRIALWRAFASGRIEPIAFPWADLSNIDSLVVSPDGSEVAYVEGGSPYGPVVIRALADGSKTLVAAHEPDLELLVRAWSPDGRKVLYATRRPHELPSSHFVFDRSDAQRVKIDVPDEFVAWLPSGEVLVIDDDDAALSRVDRGKKTRVTLGSFVVTHVALDAPRGRLITSAWDDTTHTNEVLAIDLATWSATAISPPAPYSTYLEPATSPSGKRVAWLAYDRPLRAEALVVSGKTLVAATRDLVGLAWIDDDAIVAHYENRIDVVDARDGKTKVSRTTGAGDTMR